MYKIGKQFSPLARGLHSVTSRTAVRYTPLVHLEQSSARAIATSPVSSHWRQRQDLGSAQHVCQGRGGAPMWQQSQRGYQEGKKGGGVNTAAVIGAAVAAVVGGVLLMSAGSVTDDLSKPKSDKITASDNEDESEPAPEPLKFPEQVTYLIIGAGTAAMTASKTIRKNDPKAKVLMVTEENHHPYMRPPLSKELWFKGSDPKALSFNDWAGKQKSLFYQPEEFYLQPELLDREENGGIAIACNKKVSKLDVQGQVATFRDGSSIKYDKCLLATGGSPRNLPIFRDADDNIKKRVHLFRNIDDFHRLHQATDGAKSVLVIGGGFLGSELAVALAQKARGTRTKIYQAFPEEGNMGLVFPEYLSRWSLDKVEKEGVEVYPNAFVTGCSFNRKSKQVEVSLHSGQQLSADEVVVAVGLQPNIELAESAGLEIDDKHGGFLVNAELEARKNLWVAGDAACFYDVSLGRRRVEHHDHAVVSGRLAGDNMTGNGKPYWHQSMFWSDLGPSIGYEAIGICESSLPTFAVFAKATEADTPKAVVEETGEGMRSDSETEADSPKPDSETGEVTQPEAPEPTEPHPPKDGEDYGKGVIFYTRNDKIVGIVLWNLFGRMPIARQVLKEAKQGQDLTEVARLFDVHDQKKSQQ